MQSNPMPMCICNKSTIYWFSFFLPLLSPRPTKMCMNSILLFSGWCLSYKLNNLCNILCLFNKLRLFFVCFYCSWCATCFVNDFRNINKCQSDVVRCFFLALSLRTQEKNIIKLRFHSWRSQKAWKINLIKEEKKKMTLARHHYYKYS